MQENNAGNLNDKGQDAAQSNQPAGQEALEGNTGVGGRSVDQGGDSDGNTGVSLMTNLKMSRNQVVLQQVRKISVEEKEVSITLK